MPNATQARIDWGPPESDQDIHFTFLDYGNMHVRHETADLLAVAAYFLREAAGMQRRDDDGWRADAIGRLYASVRKELTIVHAAHSTLPTAKAFPEKNPAK